jgi:hypothetical protein
MGSDRCIDSHQSSGNAGRLSLGQRRIDQRESKHQFMASPLVVCNNAELGDCRLE